MAIESEDKTESLLTPLILSVRGRRVIADLHLARLYAVSTKALNQAVKRNADRFPRDFAFQLSRKDAFSLKSQIVTSSRNSSSNQVDRSMWSQVVTTSQKYRRAGLLPWVFTEHGALMAANVLRSPRAIEMSIFVTRAFVRLREQVASNAAILTRLAEIDNTLLQHDCLLHQFSRRSAGSGSS